MGPLVDQLHQLLAAGDAGLEVPHRHVGVPGRTGGHVRDGRGRHPVRGIGGAGPVRQLGPVGRVGHLHAVGPGEHHRQVELLVSPLHRVRVAPRRPWPRRAGRGSPRRPPARPGTGAARCAGARPPSPARPRPARPRSDRRRGSGPAGPGRSGSGSRSTSVAPAGGGEAEPGQLQRGPAGQQQRAAVRVQRRQLPGPVRVELQHTGAIDPPPRLRVVDRGSSHAERHGPLDLGPRRREAGAGGLGHDLTLWPRPPAGPVPKVPSRRGLPRRRTYGSSGRRRAVRRLRHENSGHCGWSRPVRHRRRASGHAGHPEREDDRRRARGRCGLSMAAHAGRGPTRHRRDRHGRRGGCGRAGCGGVPPAPGAAHHDGTGRLGELQGSGVGAEDPRTAPAVVGGPPPSPPADRTR